VDGQYAEGHQQHAERNRDHQVALSRHRPQRLEQELAQRAEDAKDGQRCPRRRLTPQEPDQDADRQQGRQGEVNG